MSVFLILFFCIGALLGVWLAERQVQQQQGSRVCFGVSVDPNFHATPEGQHIYKTWQRAMRMRAAVVCAALLLTLFIPHAFQLAAWIAIGLLALIFLSGYRTYRDANRAVRPYAAPRETQRTASLMAPPSLPAKWKAVYIGVHVFTVAMVLAAALFLHRHADLLLYQLAFRARDARLPGAEGAVRSLLGHARWDDFVANYIYLAGAALGTVVMLLLAFGLQFRSRPADWKDGVEESFDYRRRTMLYLAFYELMIIQQSVGRALDPVVRRGPAIWSTWMLFAALSNVVLCFVLVPRFLSGRPKGLIDHIDDARWKWGRFYADRNDPAWFVPSRSGMGASANYGNPIMLVLTLLFVFSFLGYVSLSYRQMKTSESLSLHNAYCAPAPQSADSALYQLALQNMKFGDRADAAVVLTAFAQAHPEVSGEVAQALAAGR